MQLPHGKPPQAAERHSGCYPKCVVHVVVSPICDAFTSTNPRFSDAHGGNRSASPRRSAMRARRRSFRLSRFRNQ